MLLIEHTRSTHQNGSENNGSTSSLKCNLCSKTFVTDVKLNDHECSNQQQQFKCNLCDYDCESEGNIETQKKNVHVIIVCDSLLDTRNLLREHIEEHHGTSNNGNTNGDKEHAEKLAAKNSNLKEVIRTVNDDFERLSDIFKKQTQDFDEQKIAIDIDLSKTRENLRITKAENEALKVRNKLG